MIVGGGTDLVVPTDDRRGPVTGFGVAREKSTSAVQGSPRRRRVAVTRSPASCKRETSVPILLPLAERYGVARRGDKFLDGNVARGKPALRIQPICW